MSRTKKWEHPSDTIRQCHKQERKARPANGRRWDEYVDYLAELDDPFGNVQPITYVPAGIECDPEFGMDLSWFSQED